MTQPPEPFDAESNTPADEPHSEADPGPAAPSAEIPAESQTEPSTPGPADPRDEPSAPGPADPHEPAGARPDDPREETSAPAESGSESPVTHEAPAEATATSPASLGTAQNDTASVATPAETPAAPTAPTAPEWTESTQRLEPDHAPTTQIPPLSYAPPAGGSVRPAAKKRNNRFARNVAVVTGIVLLSGISGVTGAAVFHASTDENLPVSQTALDRPSQTSLAAGNVEKVAAAVLPSTVKINVAGGGAAGQGTGVIISEDGVIVTNNHVIEAAAERGQITVVFQDGTNASASILGRDPATDVAVIKAEDVSGLKPATLGNSSNLNVGQPVVAIGSPFGLEATVTDGIVSALNRPVSPGDQRSNTGPQTIFPAIQTDAAINPGNSGGPLVDLAGRVIGINSAISTGGGSAGSIGLGFAIPINLVSSVSEQILAGDEVEHARIGVNVVGATGEDNITQIGAEIGEVVRGSAGDKAGLRTGDIVTSVDGHPVATNDGLVATIRGYRPGESVTLTILRDGKPQEIDLTLGSDRDARN